jgi:hypothetical protein
MLISYVQQNLHIKKLSRLLSWTSNEYQIDVMSFYNTDHVKLIHYFIFCVADKKICKFFAVSVRFFEEVICRSVFPCTVPSVSPATNFSSCCSVYLYYDLTAFILKYIIFKARGLHKKLEID